MGGIVKNATTNQAIAGTNKCDVITPYTLQAKLNNDLVDFTPTKPQTVTASIKEGSPIDVCVNYPDLLDCEADALTTAGVPAIGNFTLNGLKYLVWCSSSTYSVAENATGSDTQST